LRPDDPSGNQAEQYPGDSEGDGVRFHARSSQLSVISFQPSAGTL
jgi:hypothetical protein